MQRSIIAPAERVTNLRWGIAILIGIGIFIFNLDRANLSVAGPALRREFGLDDAGFGLLLAAYAWAFAAAALPLGIALDRSGVTRLGRVAAPLWGLCSLLAGGAGNVAALIAARLGLGLAEAPAYPLAAKAIGAWFPAAERGRATAIFDGAAKYALAAGLPLAAAVGGAFGWRATFLLTGALSLAFGLAFAVLYRNPATDARLTHAERAHIANGGGVPEDVAPGAAPVNLRGRPAVWGLAAGYAAWAYSFSLVATWLPAYLTQSFHLTALAGSGYAAIPWLAAGSADLLAGGWLADATRARTAILATGMVLGLGMIGAMAANDPGVAAGWLTVSLVGLSIAAPILWSTAARIAPAGRVGTVAGIANGAGALAAIAAPLVTGALAGASGNFTRAFGIAATLLALGTVLYALLVTRRTEEG